MKKLKTGDIYREFKSRDEDTIVRRLNLRMYTKDAKIKHTICQSKWLIDFDDLLNSLNPKGYTETKELPRIRTKIGAQKEWNAVHRRKIKHYIIDCICDSGKVFVFKHGRTNIINYDELEQELIKILKERGKY
jgi:hypothetical protein